MELALAVLLISSLTCVGLLALWVATSPRHWFLRTAVFVGAISLLLLIPAYEPFVAFALQGAVIAVGVQLAWRRHTAPPDSSAKRQFSLATLLQVIVLVAIAAAIAPRLPTLNLEAWQSVLLIGFVSGLATLTGHWMCRGSHARWKKRMLIGAAFAVLLSVLLLFGDWFVVALLDLLDWPPDKTSPWLTSPLRAGFSIWIWVPVTLAIACFVGLSTWLNELLTITHPSTEAGPDWPSASHWTIVSIATVLGSCLALPSAVVYYQLVTPLPIPDQHIPEPNGYDDFRAAWALLGANLLVDSGNFDVRTSSTAQLRKAVDQVLPSLERARVGIFRSVMFPIDYTRRSDIYLDDMQQMRSLSRGFQAQGNLFIREQDFTGAMTTFLDAIDYGIHARTGGLIVNELVGIACAGVGRSDLYHVREEMTAKQSRQAIERLATALANVEPHEQFGHRDRVWTQQVDGWFGHLLQLLTELTGDYRFMDPADFGKPYLDEQAVMRLLIVELALQAHLLEHGQLPNELAELVPDYLPNVPLDPLSADSSPLNYRRTEDGYVLYSVGHNGIDDGGTGPQLDENGWSDDTTGDLRLDVIFAPYEEETENTAEDAEESAKTEQ